MNASAVVAEAHWLANAGCGKWFISYRTPLRALKKTLTNGPDKAERLADRASCNASAVAAARQLARDDSETADNESALRLLDLAFLLCHERAGDRE